MNLRHPAARRGVVAILAVMLSLGVLGACGDDDKNDDTGKNVPPPPEQEQS